MLVKAKVDSGLMASLGQAQSIMYNYCLAAIGIAQLVLNLLVLGVTFTTLCKKRYERNKYVFWLMSNLAFADIVGFCAVAAAMNFSWYTFRDRYFEDHPQEFLDRMQVSCPIHHATYAFYYLNTLLSTIMLTLERYTFITRPFTYDKYVNGFTVSFAMGIAWFLPAFTAAVIINAKDYFFKRKMCNPCHLASALPTSISASVLVAALLSLHILYFHILSQCWHLKRRNSLRRANNRSQLKTSQDVFNVSNFSKMKFHSLFDSHPTAPVLLSINNLSAEKTSMSSMSSQSCLKMKKSSLLTKLKKFTSTIKYVIIILSTFTLCWLPWITVFFTDVLYHISGSYHSHVQSHCNKSEPADMPYHESIAVQLCVHGYFKSGRDFNSTNCDILTQPHHNWSTLCAEVYFHSHNWLISSGIIVSIVIAAVNSLANPFIYSLCSLEFRDRVYNVLALWRIK